MSNEIQSISQSNYVLHNIDAKKLYVQEPLFTANSGDAVYVGWRPDETVLWSGTGSTTAELTLSDNYTNYERIKIFGKWHYNAISNATTFTEFYTNDNGYFTMGATVPVITTGLANQGSYEINGVYQISGNKITPINVQRYTLDSSGNRGAYSYQDTLFISQVIGVNRKENA